ncbi:MAG: O-antigen ligase family protein [Solirubrobacteraceae bacterium]
MARQPKLIAAALVASMLAAALVAYDIKVGLAVIAALCLVPVALLRLPLAVCAWLVIVFFGRLPSLESAPNRVLLVVAACWLAMLLDRRVSSRSALESARAMVTVAVLFVVWEALTLAWAPELPLAQEQLKFLLYCCLGLVVVLGTITESQHVRWLMIAFVLGAVLSVLLGVADGSLRAGSELTSAAAIEGERFQGGSGDPNYLAAVLVPAIVLAGGLALRKSVVQRIALVIGIVILAVGLAATRSRGGLIAAVVACVVALAIWRGRRLLIGALITLFVGVTAAFFISSPAAWQRIYNTGDSGSGSGRLDVWHVALRVAGSHPLFGVGLGQFPAVSPHYVNLPGVLTYVGLIVDQHLVVHNLYLQLWAESGIVGLLLFLALVVLAFAGAWRAIARFEALGDEEMTGLSRAVIPALVGVLTASFFLSNISDRRIWVLLALGPVLAGIAERQARRAPEAASSALLE